MNSKPLAVNSDYFSTETFPEIIGFCEKDRYSHVQVGDEESFVYKLNGKKIYLLKKKSNRWEIVEYDGEQIVRVNTNKILGIVISQALTYASHPNDKQEFRVSILIPINKTDMEKALAVMYYLGGYPTNFLQITPELQLIMERFLDPDLAFLSYSYVPIQYLPWLNDELKKSGLIGQNKSRTILMYKK